MDRARVEQFLETFLGYASGATTIGLLAVADRTGMLRWLASNGPATAHDLAEGASLDERYVIEVLSGLAAAGTLEYDAGTETFELPAEHAAFVAHETSPYFMGGWMDMLPAMLSQVEGVARAATYGGGVGFEEFGASVIKGIDRGNAPSQRVFLTRRWIPAIPGMVERLEHGARAADVGCGAGTVPIELGTAFPKSRFFGFDISSEALAVARSRAADLDNVEFAEYRAEAIPTEPPYDLITTFDVIHDLANPLAGLTRIREALAEGGRYLMMEPNMSSDLEENMGTRGALLYGVSALHCMTQSLAVGGEGLGAAWGRQRAEEYAERAGFSDFTELESITNRFSSFYLLSA